MGDLQSCPTIVAVLFTDDGHVVKGVEGEDGIRRAIRTNMIHQVIKDLIGERIKLKIAEKMAEQLAGVFVAGIVMRRRQAALEYSEKLKEEKEELESKGGSCSEDDLSELSKNLVS